MNTPTLMIIGASLAGATVTALDTGNSRVALDDGRELHYDRLLLATGANRGASRARARRSPASRSRAPVDVDALI
jgi:NADPH-dependent 2,4-dienoyl-CoA reductase/sulfur reductase-like enzyme